jgi:SAM-dependent methyltransferase
MESSEKVILNIGCGTTRIPGSIGVDKFPIQDFVDVVHDLDVVPYPFEDNSVDRIHMYHVLEHLHDPLFKVEELHRILKPGGKLYIRVPHFSSMGAFSDMTHVRPFGHGSFQCFVEGEYHSFYTKARFKIHKKEIKYLGLYPNSGTYEKYVHHNQCHPIMKPFVLTLNFLIGLSPMLFERVWCYWVGGATEVVFNLEKDVE